MKAPTHAAAGFESFGFRANLLIKLRVWWKKLRDVRARGFARAQCERRHLPDKRVAREAARSYGHTGAKLQRGGPLLSLTHWRGACAPPLLTNPRIQFIFAGHFPEAPLH